MTATLANLNEASISVLQGARDLITDPAHWTTRRLARMVSGVVTDPTDRHAVCWCAIGALSHAANANMPADFSPYAQLAAHQALESACEELYESPIVAYVNDCLGHTKILAAFDAAIKTRQGAQMVAVNSK